MKAARLHAFRTPFSIETASDPEPGPEDAIVYVPRGRRVSERRSHLVGRVGGRARRGWRGLSAIQVAHAIGAQVIAVDIDDGKLEKARR